MRHDRIRRRVRLERARCARQRSGPTKDTTAPTATIAGLKKRYAHGRGPRELRGTVSADPSGIMSVRLAITRRKGDRCWTFAGGRERFVRHRCGGWKSFKIGDRADWSYLLPKRLGTRALHHSRGGDRQGRQRRRDAGEDPGPMKPLLLALLAGAVLAAPASAASVDVMVVGKRDVLVPGAQGGAQGAQRDGGRAPLRDRQGDAAVGPRGRGGAVHRPRLRVVLAPRARRGLALRAADRSRRRARARRLGLQGRQPLRQRRGGRPRRVVRDRPDAARRPARALVLVRQGPPRRLPAHARDDRARRRRARSA